MSFLNLFTHSQKHVKKITFNNITLLLWKLRRKIKFNPQKQLVLGILSNRRNWHKLKPSKQKNKKTQVRTRINFKSIRFLRVLITLQLKILSISL
jgi:hypothetical protein